MTNATTVHQSGRIAAAVVSLFVPAAVVLVSYFLWRDTLPPAIASHWSGFGAADDAMPPGVFLAVSLGMTGIAAIAGAIVALWPGVNPSTRRAVLLVAGIIAGMGAQTWLTSTLLTMQAGDPYDVVLGWWSLLSVVALAYGLVPFYLSPKPTLVARDVPSRLNFAPGESGAWSRTVTAYLFVWIAVALVALEGILIGFSLANGDTSTVLFALVVMAIVIVILVSFSRFRVTADWRGLRVVSSLFRVPIKRIRLEDIEMVEAGELRPTEWGGWGYRVMPGRSALILRKGPGLIVTTRNQKQFALTLDDPGVPAALLATLRDDTRPKVA
jgi:hypothetical protein